MFVVVSFKPYYSMYAITDILTGRAGVLLLDPSVSFSLVCVYFFHTPVSRRLFFSVCCRIVQIDVMQISDGNVLDGFLLHLQTSEFFRSFLYEGSEVGDLVQTAWCVAR